MKPLIIVCFTAVVLSLQGCGGQASSSAWTTKDSWHHPTTTDPYIGKASELPDKEVYKVITMMWPKAEALLKKKPIVRLSTVQAKAFVGRRFKEVPKKMPFLVRAIYLNEGTGNFTVHQQGKRLWVIHGSLGHQAVPMKRQALVVFLKARPTQVFVDCSMAE